MKNTPIAELWQKIEQLIRIHRGAGKLRNKIHFYPEKNQMNWDATPRMSSRQVPRSLIFLLNETRDEPFFYPSGYPRNRFFLSAFPSVEAWVEKAVRMSNGETPFLETSAESADYK